MRVHLYEFVAGTRKLKCSCGWERTMKTTDLPAMLKKFEEHRAETAVAR